MKNFLQNNKISYEDKTSGRVTQYEAKPLTIDEWEKKIILKSIERNFHNLSMVCRELKIGRTTLWRKMKKYNIR
jgi:transcriptional regulator with PAS, ATPase and Fis domain